MNSKDEFVFYFVTSIIGFAIFMMLYNMGLSDGYQMIASLLFMILIFLVLFRSDFRDD